MPQNIKRLVRNFVTNQSYSKKPDDEKYPYRTKLSVEEEMKYVQWVSKNRKRLGDDYDPTSAMSDYDYRGWWKENKGKVAPEGHFEDKYKTPYHETFSNESIYATPNAPKWEETDREMLLKDQYGIILKREKKQ